LGGFAIRALVALLWQHNANPSYKLASIPRYDDRRGLRRRALLAADWQVMGGRYQNCALHMGSGRGWLAGD